MNSYSYFKAGNLFETITDSTWYIIKDVTLSQAVIIPASTMMLCISIEEALLYNGKKYKRIIFMTYEHMIRLHFSCRGDLKWFLERARKIA